MPEPNIHLSKKINTLPIFEGVENVQNITKSTTLHSRRTQYVHKLQCTPLIPLPSVSFQKNHPLPAD
jgi:hypothetical protein